MSARPGRPWRRYGQIVAAPGVSSAPRPTRPMSDPGFRNEQSKARGSCLCRRTTAPGDWRAHVTRRRQSPRRSQPPTADPRPAGHRRPPARRLPARAKPSRRASARAAITPPSTPPPIWAARRARARASVARTFFFSCSRRPLPGAHGPGLAGVLRATWGIGELARVASILALSGVRRAVVLDKAVLLFFFLARREKACKRRRRSRDTAGWSLALRVSWGRAMKRCWSEDVVACGRSAHAVFLADLHQPE